MKTSKETNMWTTASLLMVAVLLLLESTPSSAQERCNECLRKVHKYHTVYSQRKTCTGGSWWRPKRCSYRSVSRQLSYTSNVTSCCYSERPTTIPDGALALHGGSDNKRDGRLMVMNNYYGTVCDDGWGFYEANVACFQMGYAGVSCDLCESLASPGNGSIWYDDVDCSTTEHEWLYQCSRRSNGTHNCSHSDDVRLRCGDQLIVRLVDGRNALEGRVEYYYNRTWGTVCDDGWNYNDAKVVCRQLGYGSPTSYPRGAHFGEGTGPIHLDDLECDGNELFLHHCTRWDFGENNCGHGKAASVVCSAPVTKSIVSYATSSTSISVHWSMVPELQHGGRIIGYRIRYAVSSSSSYRSIYINTTSYDYKKNISKLTPYTKYKFSIAVNLEGYRSDKYGSWTFSTTHQAAPGPVFSLRVTTLSSSSSCITVTWSSRSSPSRPINRYCWNATSVTSGISHSLSGCVSSSRRSVRICYLLECTRYRITVYAINGAGTGSPSSVHWPTTNIAPIGRPRSVVAKEGSSLDIMLEWQLPFILSTNCPIKGFIVYWNGGNVSTTKYRLKYRFTGLAPYTEYRFLVAAVTSAGVGPRSSSVYVRTRPTAPGRVNNLTTTSVSSKCITIAWSYPSSPNGVINRYYWDATGVISCNSHSRSGYVSSSHRSVRICYLHGGTRYRISVYARNKAGTGSRSYIHHKTTVIAPGAVKALRTTDVSSTCITVTWFPPSSPNGVIDVYYWNATSVTSGISHSRSGYVSSSRSCWKTTKLSVRICYLHEGTRYKITVFARNGAGIGSPSYVYRTTVVVAPSGPPLSVVAQVDSTLNITVRWQSPSILLRNGPIKGFIVYWNGSDVSTTSVQHRFTGLDPYTTYSFSVAARNSAGVGPRSLSVSERTEQAGVAA